MSKNAYKYHAVVERVVDGDTAQVTVDLGFKLYHRVVLRLARINTPERGMPNYAEATAKLAELLPPGSKVHADVVRKDKYGRYVTEISLDDASSVSDMMLASGLAKPYEQ